MGVRDRPIGMFDSGFGGLTVARAVIDLLPAEDLVYFGDTGRYPYGPRPLDDVRVFAQQIGDLMGRDVVLVSSADETAFEVRAVLDDRGLAAPAGRRTGRHRFLSSGDVEWFKALGSRLLGPELDGVEAWRWPA